MCASIYAMLQSFGLFQRHALPSFFDGRLTVDHEHDDILREIYAKITPPPTFAHYNPPPEEEEQVFAECPQKGNMIQRNILLMSRHFISNATRFSLREQFVDKACVRILDVGCGLAPTLPGLLAYFKKVGITVEYLGIDINGQMIAECRKAYAHFMPQVAFADTSIEDLFHKPGYRGQYDLLLCQHPNIESPLARDAFAMLFLGHAQLLSKDGVFYSTLYYEPEKEFLEREILPVIGGAIEDCTPSVTLQGSSGAYFPERFVYCSALPHPEPGMKTSASF